MTVECNGSVATELSSAVRCVCFVHEATEARTGLDLFRVADAALHEYAVRGTAERKFTTTSDGMVSRRFVLRDEQ